MSNIVLNEKAWGEALKDIPMIEVQTLLALAFTADHENKLTYRTMDMVDKSGLCRVTFFRALKALAARKMVTVHSSLSGPGGVTEVTLNKWWVRSI